jgi:hypothetical protein
MGNRNSNVAQCNNCNLISGNIPVFYLYNDDKYNGNYLCKFCYLNKDKICYDLNSNSKRINVKCDNCKVNNPKITHVKIYWNGKYKNKIFCNKCLIDKSYRQKYHK